jgi:hypothetical protein
MRLITLAAGLVATVALLPQTASAERICRQECVGPVCSEKCVETEGRGERREGVEIRDGRENLRGEERREGREGIELRAPGVDVEVGGGRR